MVSFKSALSVFLLAGTTSAFTLQPNQLQLQGQATAPISTSLCMGWGPDPIWSGSEIESISMGNLSKDSSKVTVTVPPETAQEFTIPGQYVQVRANEDTKPLFLAISSPPEAENPRFEFLIKKTDDNTWISDRDASAGSLEISQVLGGGFPMKEELESLK